MITEQNPTNSPLGVWWHLSSDEVGHNESYNLHSFTSASFVEPLQLNISSRIYANGSRPSWEDFETTYITSNSGSGTSLADIEVAYCLSAERPCSIRVSLAFQAVVVFCSACKLTAILVTVLIARGGHDHLSSAGDALSSLLERPDSYTTGRCLLSGSASPGDHGTLHTPAILQRRKRFSALSKSQVFVAIALWALLYVTMGVASYFWKQDGLVLKFSDPAGILRTLLVPNLPQLLLTFQYLVLNRCFTIMQMSVEVNKFGTLRQALRVTSPLSSVHGKQRSTYWLSLPVHFSIPLIIFGAVLHWLVSQASFAEFSISDGMGIGIMRFNNMYMFGTLVGGVVFACGAIWYGDLLLPSDMPVLGYSSLAIAAACHPPEDDSDAALKEVKWGDVNPSDAEVGHCCFTLKEVSALQPARPYA